MASPAADLPATIAAAAERETVVKKSRFIARIEPLTSLEPADGIAEAGAVVAQVRRERWDARHHCSALVVGQRGQYQRSSDDGEPAGTAGAPMLQVLAGRGLTDVVAVVTRYFGGVLLGTGGLVRAYSGALAAAIDAADVVRRALLTPVSIAVPHADAGRIGAVVHEWTRTHQATLGEVSYGGEAAVFELFVAPGELDALDGDLAAASAGTLAAVRGEPRVMRLPAG